MSHDMRIYGGAAVGLMELIAIGAVIFAVVLIINARDDKTRARASMIGIMGGVALIALLQLGKPFFN